MSNARSNIPLTSAIAVGTVVRVRGSLVGKGLTGIAQGTAPRPSYPIHRGFMR